MDITVNFCTVLRPAAGKVASISMIKDIEILEHRTIGEQEVVAMSENIFWSLKNIINAACCLGLESITSTK